MKGTFRQRMSGLHTWCGLVCGWILCAIMLTGTLSVFREPITRWMEAKPLAPTSTQASSAVVAGVDGIALEKALQHLSSQAPDARLWRLEMPQQPGDALQLHWRGPKGPEQAAQSPYTGELLPQPWGRQTEGGRHFMSFHYSLQAGVTGFWIVGGISMCMLVALVSGVVVHRRIFQDFFTFRPGKGQRSWLDAHNGSSVLALPFLFMIVYTGLAIFYTSYMPWPMQAAFGTDDKAYTRYQAALSHEAVAPRRARTGVPVQPHALAPLLTQAQALTGRPAQRVLVEQPGDGAMLIRVITRVDKHEDARHLLNPPGSVVFDGVSGAVLHVQQHDPAGPFASEQVHAVMESLHLATFGGWTVRWLYFVSGLMGTLMVATGVILFSVKRRQKSAMEFGAATAGVYRVIEALNVAAVAGICVACIAYLQGNRWLPADLPGRVTWEIRLFLLTWLATALHALVRPAARAWVEQLGLAALLCLALPLVNAWTTGQHVVGYVAAGDAQRASVELTVLGFGVGLSCAAWRVRRGWRARASRPSPPRAMRARPGASA
jgi:uncharacterized iron-regulated membrane protein